MLDDQKLDLLLVQESHRPEMHLPPLLHPQRQGKAIWEAVEGRQWGSGIYSASGTLTPVRVPDFDGWVVGAEVHDAEWLQDAATPLLVFSVHAPKRESTYSAQVNRILDEIGKLRSGRDVIIGGDFNLTVSERHESEKPTDKINLEIQRRLRDEFGLLNCWQEANPGIALHQTLRWSKDQLSPYHCDGLFVPSSWRERLRSCQVLCGEEWNEMSDHNPLIAHFE
jgi:exonuclease III